MTAGNLDPALSSDGNHSKVNLDRQIYIQVDGSNLAVSQSLWVRCMWQGLI